LERIICQSTILGILPLMSFFYAATCMDEDSAEQLL